MKNRSLGAKAYKEWHNNYGPFESVENIRTAIT